MAENKWETGVTTLLIDQFTLLKIVWLVAPFAPEPDALLQTAQGV